MVFCGPQGSGISIHALLAESDNLWDAHRVKVYKFLSTLSLRRATAPSRHPCPRSKISIHALLAESDPSVMQEIAQQRISIHALLAESDRIVREMVLRCVDFYPRSPCGERRKPKALKSRLCVISIHALLAESDPQAIYPCVTPPKFLSTLSLRRATGTASAKGHSDCNFYPRSPCGERLDYKGICVQNLEISIHALLAESDAVRTALTLAPIRISIHALLAESDGSTAAVVVVVWVFLSTLSLRRATPAVHRYHHTLGISIHALLAESDICNRRNIRGSLIFLSTLSLRRATWHLSARGRKPAYFYPRSPCGERRKVNATMLSGLAFLSTLSLRRATHRILPH